MCTKMLLKVSKTHLPLKILMVLKKQWTINLVSKQPVIIHNSLIIPAKVHQNIMQWIGS